MGVTKIVHQEGSGPQPTKGQTVTIEYTGFLKDTSKPDNKGKQYVDAVRKPPVQYS
jgi:FK506-binding protein 1